MEAQSSAITHGETRCTYLPTTVGLLGSDNITSKLFQFPYISSVFTSISTYKFSTQYPLWIWKQDEEIISNKKVNKPQQRVLATAQSRSCRSSISHSFSRPMNIYTQPIILQFIMTKIDSSISVSIMSLTIVFLNCIAFVISCP